MIEAGTERRADPRREILARRVSPHRPFHKVVPDRAWIGEPCFIIGGGPSLAGFDFERLRGKGRIIAINRAYEFCQFADVLFYMDEPFYRACHKDPAKYALWRSFAGYKVFLNSRGRVFDDTYSVRSAGRTGLSSSLLAGIFHGNNSGFGAINLAFCLGADPIYLLGFDCGFIGGASHFHSGYGVAQYERTFRAFAHDFEQLARLAGRTRTRVINLNPQSVLRCFPFMAIDQALEDEGVAS